MARIANFGMAITVGSVIETAFLATIYSGIIYLLLRRRFIEALERFIRRFGWAALAIVAAMIGSSVWLRTQLHAADYGAPLTHDSPTVNLNIRIPIESDQKITASAIDRTSRPGRIPANCDNVSVTTGTTETQIKRSVSGSWSLA